MSIVIYFIVVSMTYPFSRALKILHIPVSVSCHVHVPCLVSVQQSRDTNIFVHVYMLVNVSTE